MVDLKAAPDPVAEAIAAVEEPRSIEMMGLNITIASTGRPAQVVVPKDVTAAELAELCGWMLTQLLAHTRTQAPSPASRILVPR